MSAVGEISINLRPGGAGRDRRGVIHLAVIAESQPVLKRIVPDETGGGISERVIAKSVAAGEAAERFLEVVGVVAFGAPGVAVGGVDAIAIKVVEQYKLLSQRVVVGGNKLRIDAEAGVSIRLRHVPKHLIVGFVLFKNVEHMLE